RVGPTAGQVSSGHCTLRSGRQDSEGSGPATRSAGGNAVGPVGSRAGHVGQAAVTPRPGDLRWSAGTRPFAGRGVGRRAGLGCVQYTQSRKLDCGRTGGDRRADLGSSRCPYRWSHTHYLLTKLKIATAVLLAVAV